MEIDYAVELDYGDDGLCLGEVVGVPPEFGASIRLARIYDREKVGREDNWILDLKSDRPDDEDPDDEDLMYWPVPEDGDLVRQVSLGESDAIPNDEDVARWIVDGMRRDGLTPAAAVRVVRQ